MPLDPERIKQLLDQPNESLNVELKGWLDPATHHGEAKIARALLALRNRNGGHLVIGINDKTHQSECCSFSSGVREIFHQDKIQAIVSRYASELFEIEVNFGACGQNEHPIILVPAGVRTPVAAKANLASAGKELIRIGDVYFRTLASNGVVSSSVARPTDWRDIVEICFDNREADVGRFARRQLAGLNLESLAALVAGANSAEQRIPKLEDRCRSLLDDCTVRFEQALATRNLSTEEREAAKGGYWTIGVAIHPPRIGKSPDSLFFEKVVRSGPRLTGWEPWLDSRGFANDGSRPHVTGNGWEALVISLSGFSRLERRVSFMRLDPKGEFELRLKYHDDSHDQIRPGTVLEPILVVLRTAEMIATGLGIARALDCETEQTHVGFAFRWSSLRGRQLNAWGNPMAPISAFGKAHDDEVTSYVEVPLDTPLSSIASLVGTASRPLFSLFDGYRFPQGAIEHWVTKLINRQL